jgi:hypothetical protein
MRLEAKSAPLRMDDSFCGTLRNVYLPASDQHPNLLSCPARRPITLSTQSSLVIEGVQQPHLVELGNSCRPSTAGGLI